MIPNLQTAARIPASAMKRSCWTPPIRASALTLVIPWFESRTTLRATIWAAQACFVGLAKCPRRYGHTCCAESDGVPCVTLAKPFTASYIGRALSAPQNLPADCTRCA